MAVFVPVLGVFGGKAYKPMRTPAGTSDQAKRLKYTIPRPPPVAAPLPITVFGAVPPAPQHGPYHPSNLPPSKKSLRMLPSYDTSTNKLVSRRCLHSQFLFNSCCADLPQEIPRPLGSAYPIQVTPNSPPTRFLSVPQ